jgi:hypothetical protein
MIIEIHTKEKATNDSDLNEVFLDVLWLCDVDLKGFDEIINMKKHLSAELFEGYLIFEHLILFGKDFLKFLDDEC